jgi:hypothetical protein
MSEHCPLLAIYLEVAEASKTPWAIRAIHHAHSWEEAAQETDT